MALLGVVGVLVVTLLRPDKDNSALITSLLGFLAPTTMALLAFMKAQETHLAVNSRLDALIVQAEAIGFTKGTDSQRLNPSPPGPSPTPSKEPGS
jgi:hypothetical protein